MNIPSRRSPCCRSAARRAAARRRRPTAAAPPPPAPVAAAAPPAGQNWIDRSCKTPEGGYRMGNPDAPVKLIEYGSRTCPHCGAFDRGGRASRSRSRYDRDRQGELRIPRLPGPRPARSRRRSCSASASSRRSFFPMLEQMMPISQNADLPQATSMPPADQAAAASNAPPTQVTAYARRTATAISIS